MSKIGRRRNKENGGKKTIKLTVNIEDKYMAVIDKLVASGKFRNKTHVIEEALKKMKAETEEG